MAAAVRHPLCAAALAFAVLLPVSLAAGPAGPPASKEPRSYAVDPEVSRVVIHVAKTGLLGFAGHVHEVEAPLVDGTVTFRPDDPSQSQLHLAFDASALRVTGRGEPAGDVPEVQRTMESARVLDVERFPRITFASTAINVESKAPGELDLRVAGELTVHGVTRPETAAVSVEIGDSRLTAAGTLRIRQTNYGIEPVTAGAGTVRVKDALDIDFRIVAHASRAAPLAGR